ncbi:MAG: DUF2442 domain-containing protein [Deltaproteobacteria bacterium]|nr:DUF2442 domain-containing protein [Deltaproteobacteria bacterium]
MNISVDKQPRANQVEFSSDSLIVHLRDGRTITAPLEWFPKLRDASPQDLKNWKLIGQGIGIRWESLDEDLSVKGLLLPEETFLSKKLA